MYSLRGIIQSARFHPRINPYPEGVRGDPVRLLEVSHDAVRGRSADLVKHGLTNHISRKQHPGLNLFIFKMANNFIPGKARVRAQSQ